ncbi:bacterial PH domain protein [Anoxybacillus sp. B7M1]|jgi:hypothetical protein|uniref:PH domain-containing protein n=1 Tax=unclassified Anoxybacillus TaxID=2639704 RepID=UPI0005CC9673|nr:MULTISPECIES: PH domain-containing protein [unclassified Anoxybacillus]ANB58428.1 bacterial PH domain protein [Anoxybacillus sp. B2M1]ANB65790.1 bacterial PH domain protein [Anoxybacillus sp. B7M1]
MTFRSKIDAYFITFIVIAILFIGIVTIAPLIIDKEITTSTIVIMLSIFLFSVGFLLWSIFSIKYIFYEDYLLVKGGPFKSKIAYQEITKIAPTKDIFTGYRLLTSKNGIEIFYKSATLGSVKISPEETERFMSEIRKRCPHIQISSL